MSMIISASRRSDIPAFYSEWLINRIRAGFCTVPNPFNPSQVSRISLRTEDVDVVAFCSRNPRPLFPYLDELDERGYRYFFHYTLMNNPRQIDPHSPHTEVAIETLCRLAEHVGPERIIWRYDPIVFTPLTPPEHHFQAYQRIASALKGSTRRSIISIMDEYSKIKKRLEDMARLGAPHISGNFAGQPWFGDLIQSIASVAAQNGMEIFSCAEKIDLRTFGVQPGKCMDDRYIEQTFGIQVTHKKAIGQRKECGCVDSRDIGMYDSCLFGCQYCYATLNFNLSRQHYQQHNPQSPSLLGWYEPPPKTQLSFLD